MVRLFSKSLISFVLCLILNSCVTSPPDWYTLSSSEDGLVLGLGEGRTIEEAKSKALRSIAEQLRVQVSVNTNVHEQENINGYDFSIEQTIETRTDLFLLGAEKIREEKQGEQYFVLYQYDNRSLRTRVLSDIHRKSSGLVSSENVSEFQKSLPFSTFLRNNQIHEDFLLSCDEQVWTVEIGNQVFFLSGKELSNNFFVTEGRGNITINSGMLMGAPVIGQQANTLRNGQSFSLTIESSINGYLTLFYIDNAGSTIILVANEPVNMDDGFTYPNPHKYPDGLIAELPNNYLSSTDMLLGFITSQPVKYFKSFHSISESSVDINSDDIYGYGRLLELLKKKDLQNIEWISQIIYVSGGKAL